MISPQSHSILPNQRNTFNMGQNLMTLYGSHASGNTTDRSSFSWNDEFTNSSALSTPQGRQHQSFFNISLNPQSLSAIVIKFLLRDYLLFLEGTSMFMPSTSQ